MTLLNISTEWSAWLDWTVVSLCLAAIALYEWRTEQQRSRAPQQIARHTHGLIRANWVRHTMAKPGNEVMAVQTLRNSMMAASITASTAILTLMGTLSYVAPRLTETILKISIPSTTEIIHMILLMLLAIVLFAAFVCSSMAVRFYNHLGYMMATPENDARRAQLAELGASYAIKAGDQYSLSLRCFFYIAPLICGLAYLPLMIPGTLALLAMLQWFNEAPIESTMLKLNDSAK
ncbi:DUF599 domain-containing protein [Ampullimonas aquatilis]|uniref:DUF599 domain-containing protein n=1 Tax=Ampullimonas aquatilis TaxID=1341549 RepID=UPI003C737AED